MLQKYESFLEQVLCNFLLLQAFKYSITPTILNLEYLLKRGFDVLFALTILFFVMPWLVSILWILNLFFNAGPLFFSQHREGKDRKLFWCHKFRTFPRNAIHPKPGEAITTPIPWLGTFLRLSGIDELPQVINVIKEEMSLVGPRPHLPVYNVYYQSVVGQEKMDKRHDVLPGLTGLAQIRGYRGDTPSSASIHNRFNSDIEYINRQSFHLDLIIIINSFRIAIHATFCRIFKIR